MAKWIDFKQLPSTGKTEVWQVVAKQGGHNLGTIKWFGSWRAYAFHPEPYTVFEKTCLHDIAQKVEELDVKRRAQRLAEKMIAEH